MGNAASFFFFFMHLVYIIPSSPGIVPMENCRNIRSLIVSFTSVCRNIYFYYVDILFFRYSLYPSFLLIRFTF